MRPSPTPPTLRHSFGALNPEIGRARRYERLGPTITKAKDATRGKGKQV
jgi:hypothetical protein